MMINSSSDRSWIPTDYDGIERCVLRLNPTGGRTSLVRLAAGSRFPTHGHVGSEEVLVIAGKVRIAGATLQTGDYLFTEPGEEHDVVALEDAVIYVASQKQTPLVAQPDQGRSL